jgi:hypothetical protein
VTAASGDRVNIVCAISENNFRDRASVQLTVKDIELISEKKYNLNVMPKEEIPSTDELRTAVKYFKNKIKEGLSFFGLSSLAEHINSEYGTALSSMKAYAAVKIFNELCIIKSEEREGGLFVSESNFNGTVSLTDSALYRQMKEASRNA